MPRSLVFSFVILLAVVIATLPGCDCATTVRHGGTDLGVGPGTDLGPGADGGGVDLGGPLHDDAGYLRSCAPDSPDLEGCGCTMGEPQHACWPYTLDPALRGIGLCTNGFQTCLMDAEFAAWSPCGGAGPPLPEDCANGFDDNCDGNVDCADPTCAADPACNVGTCPEFATRDCYDGPSGTVGVGACHAGTQTCTGGVWGACMGEVVPQAEDCAGTSDLNCNRLVGCWDLFVCIASPACMEHCQMPLDPGCVCPDGTGDVGTCPRGMTAHTMGALGGSIECCPCTASDCGSTTNCCEESVCAGSGYCGGLYCPPLPASCMGRVNTDCDDFPEDCDEPCCECYGDCSGA